MYLMGIAQILKNCWLNKVNIFLYFISKARTLNLNRTVMGMEDETRDFLVRIINTIAIVLIWMIANVYLGIYREYAFYEVRPDWKNYLFYTFAVISLVLLLRHLWRKWKL